MTENTYRITTLGCRVNRADSLMLERQFARLGYRRAAEDENPGIWVVNTCAVTSEGAKKSRKAVRRCARTGAKVVVTGCAVDMEPSWFDDCPGVQDILPNSLKRGLVSRVCPGEVGDLEQEQWSPDGIARVPVKVQDGCARFCSYCVVPFLRGAPSSRARDDVVDEVKALRSLGAGEVIICGIDLGDYEDPVTGNGLCDLLRDILSQAGDIWIRLSSLDISDIDDELLGLMGDDNQICRHLHLPLQSGDEQVLADMGRDYGPMMYLSRVNEIREVVPDVAVTTDVMVGFPSETEESFEKTRALIDELGFSRVHVFKYSARPGTAAFGMGDPVSSETKHRRAAELRQLAGSTAARFHEGYIGRIIPVLVEAEMNSEPGALFGRAESFAGVVFSGKGGLVGEKIDVLITASGPDGLRGEITGRPREPDEGR